MGHVATNQAYAANKTAANYNYANRMDILGQQRVQLDQAKSENAFDTAIAGLKAQGRIASEGASGGWAASSTIGALNADMFGLGREAGTEDIKDQNQRVQLGNEATGAAIARTSQINSKAHDSGLALALGIGGDFVKGASSYASMGGKI